MADSLTPPTPAASAAAAQGFSGITPDTIRQDIAQYLSASQEKGDTASVTELFAAAHDVLIQALDAVEDEQM